jgi:hypothetical protein
MLSKGNIKENIKRHGSTAAYTELIIQIPNRVERFSETSGYICSGNAPEFR